MSQETPLQDPFEFLKKLWSPMGLPMPGVVPLLDPKEIDKRITDLKSVENWLNMNLNVLRMTIQGLEMQRATLAAFQSMQPASASAGEGKKVEPAAVASAAEAWWSLLQSQTQPPPPPEKKSRK
jgi:hypothetical protein